MKIIMIKKDCFCLKIILRPFATQIETIFIIIADDQAQYKNNALWKHKSTIFQIGL